MDFRGVIVLFVDIGRLSQYLVGICDDFCLVVLPSLKLDSLPMKNQWFIFMCFISSRKFPGLVPWMRDGLYGTTLPSPLDFCCSMFCAEAEKIFLSSSVACIPTSPRREHREDSLKDAGNCMK